MKRIRIIHPASKAPDDTLDRKILELKTLGFKVDYSAPAEDDPMPWLAGSKDKRLQELIGAIQDDGVDIILCGRGGYGASDLIEGLPWSEMTHFNRKVLIGFSDICALHAAISHIAGWPCIHGPMPNTRYWPDSSSSSVKKLLALLQGSSEWEGEFAVNRYWGLDEGETLEGLVFGGCLSVLTQLIGTPYTRQDFGGYLLFFEDINESPPRILRCFRQWLQSGSLKGVRAIILGDFLGMESFHLISKDGLCQAVQDMTQIPVVDIKGIGHGPINDPILLHSWGHLSREKFSWQRRDSSENRA